MPLEDDEASSLRADLLDSGALQQGHFRLSSGLHSSRYVQCAKLLEAPARARKCGAALARRLQAYEPQSVLSPALGGVIIGYETASALGVAFRFSERREGRMRIRRGFELQPGERVVVIEDVVTTGGSAREAAQVAGEHGARVVAFGTIIDRSAGAASFEAPLVSLLELGVEASAADDCELCAQGLPLAAPGSRSL